MVSLYTYSAKEFGEKIFLTKEEAEEKVEGVEKTMTVEQIELRKILTQMLADNGINRETLKDFVKEIIEEKVEKSIDNIIYQTSTNANDKAVQKRIDKYIDDEISAVVRQCVRETVRNTFSNVSCEIHFHNSNKSGSRYTSG